MIIYFNDTKQDMQNRSKLRDVRLLLPAGGRVKNTNPRWKSRITIYASYNAAQRHQSQRGRQDMLHTRWTRRATLDVGHNRLTVLDFCEYI